MTVFCLYFIRSLYYFNVCTVHILLFCTTISNIVETCSSVIFRELTVHLLVRVQNKKRLLYTSDIRVLCVFVVLCVYCCFYFRCRTAGWKSVFGSSCDRPHRHGVFLVSLCLQTNAELVPKIPSCHYMLLM